MIIASQHLQFLKDATYALREAYTAEQNYFTTLSNFVNAYDKAIRTQLSLKNQKIFDSLMGSFRQITKHPPLINFEKEGVEVQQLVDITTQIDLINQIDSITTEEIDLKAKDIRQLSLKIGYILACYSEDEKKNEPLKSFIPLNLTTLNKLRENLPLNQQYLNQLLLTAKTRIPLMKQKLLEQIKAVFKLPEEKELTSEHALELVQEKFDEKLKILATTFSSRTDAVEPFYRSYTIDRDAVSRAYSLLPPKEQEAWKPIITQSKQPSLDALAATPYQTYAKYQITFEEISKHTKKLGTSGESTAKLINSSKRFSTNIDAALGQYQGELSLVLNIPVPISEFLIKQGYKLPLSATTLQRQQEFLTQIPQEKYATVFIYIPRIGSIGTATFVQYLNKIFTTILPFDDISAKTFKLYLYANAIKNPVLRNALFQLIGKGLGFSAHTDKTHHTRQWIKDVNGCFNPDGSLKSKDNLKRLLGQLQISEYGMLTTARPQDWNSETILGQIAGSDLQKVLNALNSPAIDEEQRKFIIAFFDNLENWDEQTVKQMQMHFKNPKLALLWQQIFSAKKLLKYLSAKMEPGSITICHRFMSRWIKVHRMLSIAAARGAKHYEEAEQLTAHLDRVFSAEAIKSTAEAETLLQQMHLYQASSMMKTVYNFDQQKFNDSILVFAPLITHCLGQIFEPDFLQKLQQFHWIETAGNKEKIVSSIFREDKQSYQTIIAAQKAITDFQNKVSYGEPIDDFGETIKLLKKTVEASQDAVNQYSGASKQMQQREELAAQQRAEDRKHPIRAVVRTLQEYKDALSTLTDSLQTPVKLFQTLIDKMGDLIREQFPGETESSTASIKEQLGSKDKGGKKILPSSAEASVKAGTTLVENRETTTSRQKLGEAQSGKPTPITTAAKMDREASPQRTLTTGPGGGGDD